MNPGAPELSVASPDPRAVFLTTAPVATFAMLHLPAGATAGSTGVLFCPPLGWDEACTHRVRLTWATKLAESGHPAVRIDLPGTADSPGMSRELDQLGAWTASVTGAAAWMREQLGCTRVVALGIGLGGMLAWRAASQGAAIDDLILWGTPPRGRRLVRELRAAALLGIDPNFEFQTPAEAEEYGLTDPGELLDEAGQVITKETVDAIGSLDLTSMALPDPADRRVLIYRRSEAKTDADLQEHLAGMGVAVTVADGDAYGAMMRYVQDSEIPHAAIQRSLHWLAGPAPHTGARPIDVHAARSIRALDSIELEVDGVRVRETPITLELAAGAIRGILTEPAERAGEGVCGVFMSGGADRRVGPNRAWVETARRWAAQGVPGFRFDPSGVGDSGGDERGWDRLSDHYGPVHVERTVELLDLLSESGGPRRFVLVGFCSGAYRSLHTALADSRVAGVFCIGIPFLRWSWWTVNIRDSWLHTWEPRPGDGPAKIRAARYLQRSLRVINRAGHVALRVRSYWPGRADRLARQLDRQGIEVLLLLKGTSHGYEELTTPRRRARLAGLARLQVRRLPGNDQRFRPLPIQRWAADALDGAMARVVAAEQATRSCAGDVNPDPAGRSERVRLVTDLRTAGSSSLATPRAQARSVGDG